MLFPSRHRGRDRAPAMLLGRGRSAVIAVGLLLAVSGCGTTAAPSPTFAPPATPTATPTATPLDADDEIGASLAPGVSYAPDTTGAPVPSASVSATDRLPGEPNPALTPGALNPAVTQATIGSTICVSGWTASIRPPSSYTTGLKIEQMAEYGYTDRSTADYEEDHLISLELGGAPADPRNLWPEPYTASLADGRSSGAHVKDGFETRLKGEVCAGTITLAEAQAEIGDSWVHAYYGIAGAPAGPTGLTAAQPSPTTPPSASATGAYAAAKAAGASAVCADGTLAFTKIRSETCSGHGGVHWWTGNVGPEGPGDH